MVGREISRPLMWVVGTDLGLKVKKNKDSNQLSGFPERKDVLLLRVILLRPRANHKN